MLFCEIHSSFIMRNVSRVWLDDGWIFSTGPFEILNETLNFDQKEPKGFTEVNNLILVYIEYQKKGFTIAYSL